jgi:hypothetical protein
MKITYFTLLAMFGSFTLNAGAWDYDGHHMINALALASLPPDFGGFKMTPAEGAHRISRGRAGPLAECFGFAA